jgi:hypothetical protein
MHTYIGFLPTFHGKCTTYIHADIHIYIHTHSGKKGFCQHFIKNRWGTCIHTYIHTCSGKRGFSVQLHAYIHTCIHTWLLLTLHTKYTTYIDAYIHTKIYNVYIYIHTYTQRQNRLLRTVHGENPSSFSTTEFQEFRHNTMRCITIWRNVGPLDGFYHNLTEVTEICYIFVSPSYMDIYTYIYIYIYIYIYTCKKMKLRGLFPSFFNSLKRCDSRFSTVFQRFFIIQLAPKTIESRFATLSYFFEPEYLYIITSFILKFGISEAFFSVLLRHIFIVHVCMHAHTRAQTHACVYVYTCIRSLQGTLVTVLWPPFCRLFPLLLYALWRQRHAHVYACTYVVCIVMLLDFHASIVIFCAWVFVCKFPSMFIWLYYSVAVLVMWIEYRVPIYVYNIRLCI